MSVKLVFKVIKKDRKKERRKVLSLSNTITTRKKEDVLSLFLIRDLILSYIFRLRFKHLPLYYKFQVFTKVRLSIWYHMI